MWNAGLEEALAGIKIARRNINNLRYADDTILMAESEEELKSLLMKVKDESEKVGLKLNIQKTKIMASGPITSQKIDWETVETVRDFILGGSKITADGACNHEIKRRLLLERKTMANVDSIFKSRDITLPTKVYLVKAMVFPVVMYGCESWTIKKAEHWRIMLLNWGVGEDSWESLGLQGGPTVHPKGNQSWIFIGRTDAEAELQYFGHLIQRTVSSVENLMLRKTEGRRKRGCQRMRWMIGWHHQLEGHEFEQDLEVADGQGSLVCCSPWGCKESDKTEWLICTEKKLRTLPRWKVVTDYMLTTST